MDKARAIIAAGALALLAGVLLGQPAETQAGGPLLDCGPDQTGPPGAFSVSCTHDPILQLGTIVDNRASIDWGDGSPVESCPVVPLLYGTVECGPHAYAALGSFTVEVRTESDCIQPNICLCDFEPLLCDGPCANLPGAEICDDVKVSVQLAVGGVAELPDAERAPSQANESSSARTLIVLAMALAATTAVALGAVALWARRRRYR